MAVLTNGTTPLFRVGCYPGNASPPSGQTDAGGVLMDISSGVGLRRGSGGSTVEVIYQGTPRDAYGVSFGSDSGWCDPGVSTTIDPDISIRGGVFRVVKNGSYTFTAGTATLSNYLNNGSNLLRLDEFWEFIDVNVLRISITITNVSGTTGYVRYRRIVDYDMPPTTFSEIITLPAITGLVTSTSYCGSLTPPPSLSLTEAINPLAAFTFAASTSGETVGSPSGLDLGIGVNLDIGNLSPGQSISISVFHALTTIGQTEASLIAQLTGLGAYWVGTSKSSNAVGTVNTAALGIGGATSPPVTSSSSAASSGSSSAPTPPSEQGETSLWPNCPCCGGSSSSSGESSQSSSSSESPSSASSEEESSSESSEESSSSSSSSSRVSSSTTPVEADLDSSSSSSGVPRVLVSCCPQPVPEILYLVIPGEGTVTLFFGGCTGSSPVICCWYGQKTMTCGQTVFWKLCCSSQFNEFSLEMSCDGAIYNFCTIPGDYVNCGPPINGLFQGPCSPIGACSPPCGPYIDMQVTE